MLEFYVAWSQFDVAWGHYDVAWQKLWHKNDVFDEILGCAGHLTLTKKKWAPVAVKIFYKYDTDNSTQYGSHRFTETNYMMNFDRQITIISLYLTPIFFMIHLLFYKKFD